MISMPPSAVGKAGVVVMSWAEAAIGHRNRSAIDARLSKLDMG
jgi:hypothetical protein